MDNTKRNHKAKMHEFRRRYRKGEQLSARQLDQLRAYEDEAEAWTKANRPGLEYHRVTVPGQVAVEIEEAAARIAVEKANGITQPVAPGVGPETVTPVQGADGQTLQAPPSDPDPMQSKSCPYCQMSANLPSTAWSKHFETCQGEKPAAAPEAPKTKPVAPQAVPLPPVEPDPHMDPKAAQKGAKGATGPTMAQLPVILKNLDPSGLAKGITRGLHSESQKAQAEGLQTLPDWYWPIFEEMLTSFLQEKIDQGNDLRKLRLPVLALGAGVTVVQGTRAAKMRAARGAGGEAAVASADVKPTSEPQSPSPEMQPKPPTPKANPFATKTPKGFQ